MLKKGKEEIIYLLNKVIDKFQLETGKEIVQNTNRKNYEGIAIALSEISNRLPQTADLLGHIIYETDSKTGETEYPFRKYDITGGQIKDALMGLVASPRPFLVDTCYIYLYNKGRLAFESNPIDANLVSNQEIVVNKDSYSIIKENQQLKLELAAMQPVKSKGAPGLLNKILIPAAILLCIGCILSFWFYRKLEDKMKILKKDLNIVPYQVTKSEIDSIEGIWLCYTGSPQARLSDQNRFHKVVTNLIEITYKEGYFIYNRFGASFNHIGYMQFEAPNMVSIHSHIKNQSNKVESPRHSLLSLDKKNGFLTAISASWNFDFGVNNRIIGIREIYSKLGKGGTIEEVINSVENASCQCKIIKWHQPGKKITSYYLKNTPLDSLKDPELARLIDEKSILLKDPEDGLLLDKKN